MNYQDYEKMYGGIPDYTENDKFIEMVQKNPPMTFTFSVIKMCGRPQIIFMDAETGERVESYGKEFVYDDLSKLSINNLIDGTYFLRLRIRDIFGDYLDTGLIRFTISGNNITVEAIS